MCVCLFCVSLPGDNVFCWLFFFLFHSVCFLPGFFFVFSPTVFPVGLGLVPSIISCDHDWIRSGSVNVRPTTNKLVVILGSSCSLVTAKES